MTTRASSDPVVRFTEAAAAWGKANAESDWRRANQLHDRLVAALREVLREGENTIRRVTALMNHPDDGVAGWAATFALRFEPDQAVKVLERLAARPGLEGYSMTMTIREWKRGTLEFAWERPTR